MLLDVFWLIENNSGGIEVVKTPFVEMRKNIVYEPAVWGK